MTCQAPALTLGPDHQSDLTERPEEFGFILDNVQSLLILNKTNFTYYPNPVFEAFGPSGILELKPGTPIILKVRRGWGRLLFRHPYRRRPTPTLSFHWKGTLWHRALQGSWCTKAI